MILSVAIGAVCGTVFRVTGRKIRCELAQEYGEMGKIKEK